MPGSRGTSAFRRVQVWRPLAGAQRRCGRFGVPLGSALAFPVRGPGSRMRARWQRLWRRRLVCASRWRRRYGAEPSAGGLLRPGQHAHRHGRSESEGHVGGNVLSPASLRRAPRPRPSGPWHCPVSPLGIGAPHPGGPVCRPPRAEREGRLRADGARGARAPGRVSLNCHEGRVAAAPSGCRARGAWFPVGAGFELPVRARTQLSRPGRGSVGPRRCVRWTLELERFTQVSPR